MADTLRPDRTRPLGRSEWASIGGMAAFVLALHVIGWGSLIFLVSPANYQVGNGQVFGIGLGLTAYTLGLRHAFDADHIAAIDNTTRKLMSEGKRPLSVGFWFSLGHSSVVFGLCVLLALGVRALAGEVSDDGSPLHSWTGLVGTLVSSFGTFWAVEGLGIDWPGEDPIIIALVGWYVLAAAWYIARLRLHARQPVLEGMR